MKKFHVLYEELSNQNSSNFDKFRESIIDQKVDEIKKFIGQQKGDRFSLFLRELLTSGILYVKNYRSKTLNVIGGSFDWIRNKKSVIFDRKTNKIYFFPDIAQNRDEYDDVIMNILIEFAKYCYFNKTNKFLTYFFADILNFYSHLFKHYGVSADKKSLEKFIIFLHRNFSNMGDKLTTDQANDYINYVRNNFDISERTLTIFFNAIIHMRIDYDVEDLDYIISDILDNEFNSNILISAHQYPCLYDIRKVVAFILFTKNNKQLVNIVKMFKIH